MPQDTIAAWGNAQLGHHQHRQLTNLEFSQLQRGQHRLARWIRWAITAGASQGKVAATDFLGWELQPRISARLTMEREAPVSISRRTESPALV